MWVGRRPSLDEMGALTGLRTAPVDELAEHLRKDADTIRRAGQPRATWRRRRAGGAGRGRPARRRPRTDEAPPEPRRRAADRAQRAAPGQGRLRGRRDARGVRPDGRRLRGGRRRPARARCAAGRGERWVEGVFGLHARHVGNAVGYDTIAAAGDHACTLHWIRNDGDLRPGDLLLLDAGVELDSLYTADVTRTLPVSGTFSEPQRRVYEAVLAAQEAGHRRRPAGRDLRRRAPRGHPRRSRSTSTRGACCPCRSRRRCRRRAASTDAGCRTAPRTTWGSTCTTAPRRGARTTARAPSRPAW